jgi:hypothetical protein
MGVKATCEPSAASLPSFRTRRNKRGLKGHAILKMLRKHPQELKEE